MIQLAASYQTLTDAGSSFSFLKQPSRMYPAVMQKKEDLIIDLHQVKKTTKEMLKLLNLC